MWRFESVHERSETEYLDQVMDRVCFDSHLLGLAHAKLHGASQAEPLLQEALQTPQDIRYHAEGPFLRDHLNQMLLGLYALVEEKVHLIDIEEFRRMKGYEGEIDELEETIKEHAALFEVFALCHDVAKWSTIHFTSHKHSRGRALGFQMGRNPYDMDSHVQRPGMRDQYLELYKAFADEHPGHTAVELQREFYLTYEIDVHYPHHGRQIHTLVYEALLERFVLAHELSGREYDLLIDLISHHMEFNKDFVEVRPSRMKRYAQLSQSRGWDSDDFIDLLQGCILLDIVFGSTRVSAHGYWHDASPLLNALESEHQYIPERRAEKLALQKKQEGQERNRLFRNVGLDGMALMDLLGMEAGPDFGRALRRIQAGVLGQGDMPKFGKSVDREIENRALTYYKKAFQKGE